MKKILISVVAVLTMVAGVFWFVNNRSTTQKDWQSTNQQLLSSPPTRFLKTWCTMSAVIAVELYSIVKRGTARTNMNRDRPTLLPLSEADVVFHNGLNLKLAEMVGSKVSSNIA